MKQLYCSDDRFRIMNFKNIIENEGIEVTLKNDFTHGGAIPGHAIWLELWVGMNDLVKANELLEKFNLISNESEWVCSNCSEQNDASFEICWNCSNASS